MKLLEIVHALLANFKQRRRNYILFELKDYDEYIKRSIKRFNCSLKPIDKSIALMDLANAYFMKNDIEKAILTIKKLNDYEMDDNSRYIYYYNLFTFYMYLGNQQMIEEIFNECRYLRDKFKDNYKDINNFFEIAYYNSKGRYEESAQIIKENKLANTNNDSFKLYIAETYFNTDCYEEGKNSLRPLLKNYAQKSLVTQKRLDMLAEKYMSADYLSAEYKHNNEVMPFEGKLWNNAKNSNIKTSLLLTFIGFKHLFHKKWFVLFIFPLILMLIHKFILSPILTGLTGTKSIADIILSILITYLYGGIGYSLCRYFSKNKRYISSIAAVLFSLSVILMSIIDIVLNTQFKNVFASIILPISVASLWFIIGGSLAKYFTKQKKYFAAIIVILIFSTQVLLSAISINFIGNVLDLKYVLTDTNVSKAAQINKLELKHYDDSSTRLIIYIDDMKFKLNDDDELYYYVLDNFEKGDKVEITYLPNSKVLLDIDFAY